MKHQNIAFLKISSNQHNLFFFDANFPIRSRAQQQAKYCSLELTGNCVTALRCLRHYIKLIWESPATEDTNFHRH